MDFETDYLVIGAGATALAFVDELISHDETAQVMLVDRRDACGGHWNDAYPFVRLHQPASFYGVGSRELDSGRLDSHGPNAGFMTLSSGPEVVHYFHAVLRERLLPSGRVRFLPMCEAQPDGTLRGLLDGRTHAVAVRRRTVDASRWTNEVPATHERRFGVAAGLACVPPNDLPRRAARHRSFVVLGGGKTGIDACCWLLEHGAPPSALTWVVPRDSWFFNRAHVQPTMARFDAVFAGFAAQREAMAQAGSTRDLALRMEALGAWLRMDAAIEPTMFHYATVSEGELAQLRSIGRVLRHGRVREIAADGALVFDDARIPLPADSLYVDCTASALTRRSTRPVFDGARITLQMLRVPQPCFSAAMIARLETLPLSDDERNACARPIPMFDTVEDFPLAQAIDLANRGEAMRHAALRDWMARTRLDGFSHLAAQVDPADAERMALIGRVRTATKAAALNLAKLAA